MARRGRGQVLQVMPSYTEEDLLKETGLLLQQSKELRENVATHWQIKPEDWNKSLADSSGAVHQYTRWAVTGPALEQMTQRAQPGDNSWNAAKAVSSQPRALWLCCFARRAGTVRALASASRGVSSDAAALLLRRFGPKRAQACPTQR